MKKSDFFVGQNVWVLNRGGQQGEIAPEEVEAMLQPAKVFLIGKKYLTVLLGVHEIRFDFSNDLQEAANNPPTYELYLNRESAVKKYQRRKGTMNEEQLNTVLYQKIFEEQEVYRNWLLSQTPEEILNHAYEYSVREDILLSFEYNDLNKTQCMALLNSANPLQCIYEKWDTLETSYMEIIWDVVQQLAQENSNKKR